MTTIDSLGRVAFSRVRLSPGDFDWHDLAECRAADVDPAWFHSPEPLDIHKALAICETCPVRQECGEDRQRLGAPGVWGGVRYTSSGKTRLGPDRRFIPSGFSEKQKARRIRVRALYTAGWSTTRIAETLGVHAATVRNDLRVTAVEAHG